MGIWWGGGSYLRKLVIYLLYSLFKNKYVACALLFWLLKKFKTFYRYFKQKTLLGIGDGHARSLKCKLVLIRLI